MAGYGRPTNHDNPSAETLGSQGTETNLAGDGANRLALVFGFTQEGDYRICGVRDDGADNTCEVSGCKGDAELGALAVCGLGFGEDVCVEERDDLLEEEELGHGVGDLKYVAE